MGNEVKTGDFVIRSDDRIGKKLFVFKVFDEDFGRIWILKNVNQRLRKAGIAQGYWKLHDHRNCPTDIICKKHNEELYGPRYFIKASEDQITAARNSGLLVE